MSFDMDKDVQAMKIQEADRLMQVQGRGDGPKAGTSGAGDKQTP